MQTTCRRRKSEATLIEARRHDSRVRHQPPPPTADFPSQGRVRILNHKVSPMRHLFIGQLHSEVHQYFMPCLSFSSSPCLLQILQRGVRRARKCQHQQPRFLFTNFKQSSVSVSLPREITPSLKRFALARCVAAPASFQPSRRSQSVSASVEASSISSSELSSEPDAPSSSLVP